MGVFTKSDPQTKLQRDLDAKIAARTDNAARTATAEQKLIETRSKVEVVALETDDIKLDLALNGKRAAEDKLTALKAASISIANDISSIEAMIAQLADQKMRGETVSQIETLAAKWTEREAVFIAAAKSLEEAAIEIVAVIPDTEGTTVFLKTTIEQVPVASNAINAMLRGYASQVLSGGARATMPKPPAPAPKLVVVERPPVKTVFLTRHIAYTDSEGRQRRLQKMNDVDLSPILAARAIQLGCAVEINDPLRRQHKGSLDAKIPALEYCTILDDTSPVAEKSADQAINPFTPLDRGPAFNVRVPVAPIAIGSRSLPTTTTEE